MLKSLNLGALLPEEIALALGLWLCILPLAGLVLILLFGVKTSAIAAVVLLFVAVAACRGVCRWHVMDDEAVAGNRR
ncbi:MAG TPA: hypothetical protein VLC52_16020 [Anaerolineae bacterium]|nr:hypothetical protein [Anaerolineae bacterium]